MKTLSIFFIIAGLAILSPGCSSTQETTESKEEIYVFDEIPDKDLKLEEPSSEFPDLNVTYYVVQIGAFTTKEKAETFADKSRSKLTNGISISYSDDINLYVVQLTPIYTARGEAETMRNSLWQMEDFKDAWILTVSK